MGLMLPRQVGVAMLFSTYAILQGSRDIEHFESLHARFGAYTKFCGLSRVPTALNLPHVAEDATVICDSIVGAAARAGRSRHAVEVKAARFHCQSVRPASNARLALFRG